MANGNFIKAGSLAVLALAAASSFASSTNILYQQQRDTLPADRNVYDRGLRQLDKAMEKLDAQFNDPRWQQEMGDKLQSAMDKLNNVKWEQEFNRGLEKVNFEKMQRDLQESLSKIDMEKVKREMSRAMDKLDSEKIWKDVQKSFDKAKWDDMKQDLKREMDKVNSEIDFDKLKREIDIAGKSAMRELEKAKKEGSREMKAEMDKLRSDLKKQDFDFGKEKIKLKEELEKARVQLEAVKEELSNYKSMTREMEKDGLIEQDGNYDIEFNDGNLTINGEKQPKKVVKKYRKYFKKEDVRIRKEKDKLNIQ